MAYYDDISTNDTIFPVLKEDGSPEIGKDGSILMEENDINYIEHSRLTVEATMLRDIVAQLRIDKDMVNAFTQTHALRHNALKWDPETIKLYIDDARVAVRNNEGANVAVINNNFDVVKERITTGRESIFAMYTAEGLRPNPKKRALEPETIPSS